MREGVGDPRGRSAAGTIRDFLDIPVRRVETRDLYLLELDLEPGEAERAASELFSDPVIHRYAVDGSLEAAPFDFSVVVSFRPGVTDNVGRTAAEALGELLNRPVGAEGGVSTATQYLLEGVDREQAERIARELLANDLIQNAAVQDFADWRRRGALVPSAAVHSAHSPQVSEISLEVSQAELERISRERVLALSLPEMEAIRDYFRNPEVRARRRGVGLGENPTDVELEALAQTWSEHCHHKIFNATIHYTDERGERVTIRSLFRSYIRRVTEEIGSDWLLSVFRDNAGVIRFNDRTALVYKVETHNTPSALDPYGGAMTGIVGVNRDPFGTGLGARLIANVWGYCLGSPFWRGPLPRGMLHPRRVREGVHRGVIEGGNQSGIPYARGWELFDRRYMGKPLVFCGTLGEMPLQIGGVPSWHKEVRAGDAVVMVGGRVGKDGIHGATFSSEELRADSPVQAVQIGDPITQKRMTDMLLEARDRLLYQAITDNGAGGLSSSVGEMATLSGGCEIDLAQVPLKYRGLDPWEILVSEAQERMTLAVPPERLPEYLELSGRRRVESTPLGTFTASGVFHARYGERTVAYLDLEFLHHGDPPYELEATFQPPRHEEPGPLAVEDHGALLGEMLSRLNLCSGEEKARQYDHEVQGRTAVKPFGGARLDVPTDATVLLAGYEGREGIVLTEGVNPFLSEIDTYWMAAWVLDLAVRRVVAAGGDPSFIAALDNFCWPSPVRAGVSDREHKLAQLVRANQGLYDFCRAYRVPLISGKDSMSNDSTLTDPPLSVPPTLLVSVIGRIADVSRALTPDPKEEGELLYLVGETGGELGGSELYRHFGEKTRGEPYVGNDLPRLEAERMPAMYRALHLAAQRGLLRSCHAPAMGGLALGLARLCLAGDCGLEVDLRELPGGAANDLQRLYAESGGRLLLTAAPGSRRELEALLAGQPLGLLGTVRGNGRLVVSGAGGGRLMDCPVESLRRAWKETLHGI